MVSRRSGVGDGAHAGFGGADQGAADHGGDALGLEEGDDGLAGADLADRGLGVEGGVGAEGLGGLLQGLGVAGGEGAERVLDAVAELGEDVAGDVVGVLGAEVDADPLGADQADDLDDLVGQGLGGVGEEEVGLVEEEDEDGLVGVADLGELLEELGEEPEQEHRVEARRLHQPVGHEDVDAAAARRRRWR